MTPQPVPRSNMRRDKRELGQRIPAAISNLLGKDIDLTVRLAGRTFIPMPDGGIRPGRGLQNTAMGINLARWRS